MNIKLETQVPVYILEFLFIKSAQYPPRFLPESTVMDENAGSTPVCVT